MENKQGFMKLRSRREPNVIILTEAGIDKLSNENEWCDKNFQMMKEQTLGRTKLYNSMSGDLNRNSKEETNGNGTFTQNLNFYSKKVVKKHQIWNSTRQSYSKLIKRRLDMKNNQQFKEVQWPLVTKQYRGGITQIFKSWQNLHNSEKSRTKQRLKQIYHQKYLTNPCSRKQEITDFEERSFLEPRRISKINYNNQRIKKQTEKNEDQTKSKECKIYFKMLNRRNQTENI